MRFLLNRSKAIQLGAFHVFKIFVGNPGKPPQVRQILCRNQSKLMLLLPSFLDLQSDDLDLVQDIRPWDRESR
jgi:calcium binding protein 39